MSLPRFLLAATLCLSTPTYAAVSCPETQGGKPLTGVSVYDGPLAEMADLVPDDSSGKPGHESASWDVAYIYKAGRKPFLACRYADTQKPLAIEATEPVTHCTITEMGKGKPPVAACN